MPDESTFVLEIPDAVAPGVPLICEVESFRVGPDFAPSVLGGGSGTGRATFNDFSVTRIPDEQSSALLTLALTGKNLPSMSIVQESFVGDNFSFSRLFTFTNSILSSFSSTGSGNGGSRAREFAVFNFQGVSVAAQ